jgi:hypothetical protein
MADNQSAVGRTTWDSRQGRLALMNGHGERATRAAGLPPPAANQRAGRQANARRALYRWLVHIGLIATLVVSLLFEPLVLTIHIVVGLAFAVLVGAHLAQRRRVSANLAGRLVRVTTLGRPAGRLALADALLAAVTLAMLVSGFCDWFAGHSTRIRWHALTGVAVAVLLAIHTFRRWSRLRRSRVR